MHVQRPVLIPFGNKSIDRTLSCIESAATLFIVST